MSAAFTCNWQPQSIQSNQQHRQHADLISRPFVQLQTAPYSDAILNSPLNIPMIANLDGSEAILSPSLYKGTDRKSLYTTVQVTNLTMPKDMSPSLSATEPGSPSSVNDEDGKQELQPLIKPEPATETAPDGLESRVLRQETAPKKPGSRASSISKRQNRSTSRSTTGRSVAASARSSLQLPSRQVAYGSLSPSSSHRSGKTAMSRQKRDELISLHRESCRLFQESGSIWTGLQQQESRPPGLRQSVEIKDFYGSERPCRTNTTPAYSFARTTPDYMSTSSISPSHAMSPVLDSRFYPSPVLDAAAEHDSDPEPSDADSVLIHPAARQSRAYSESERPSKQVPATVIDWTSPSTRKREYEKIDRSARGIRGLWRRFAPRWCQTESKRTPFYEIGKHGKPNYEGSVRRFRMDVPKQEAVDDVEFQEKSVGLGGDGQDDSSFCGKFEDKNRKSTSSIDDRGTWRCLKVRRRTVSTS